jgi:hypothetical protein
VLTTQATNPLVTGNWELRIYCDTSSSNPDFANDAYFSLAMTVNTTAGTWAISVPKTATTVSLTAGATGSTITLTGTVKDPSNAVATAAVGSIVFFNATTNAQVGTGVVTNGVGSYTTGSLTPGFYQYYATFVGNSDPTYGDSGHSGNASASIAGSNFAASTITVTIPSGTGSLVLTGVQSAIDLGNAALNGGVLTATGTLGPVTVTDTRQLDAANWSLTGQTSDFTSGANTLLGKYLGWAPALVAGSNAGTAGATVLPAPGSANGLKTASSLATGPVVDGTPATTVTAALNLAAPVNTPAGSYSATLTITLV